MACTEAAIGTERIEQSLAVAVPAFAVERCSRSEQAREINRHRPVLHVDLQRARKPTDQLVVVAAGRGILGLQAATSLERPCLLKPASDRRAGVVAHQRGFSGPLNHVDAEAPRRRSPANLNLPNFAGKPPVLGADGKPAASEL